MAVVVVTGCSTGFGRLIAEEFARGGNDVYATLRPSPAPCQAPAWDTGPGSIHTVEMDVTDGASILAAVRAVMADAGRIDVLVNNAGVHWFGAFEDLPEDDLRTIFEVNFFGPVRVTRAVLPFMRERQSGHVIMMSSVGALVSRAVDAYYCASKSALEAAAEALRHEVARFGIRVTAVEPGAFRTGVAEKGAAAMYDLGGSPYADLVRFRSRKVREACLKGDDPAIIARTVVQIAAGGDGRFRVPAGAQAQAMVETLRTLDDAARDAFIRERSQVDWWIRRGDEPG